MGPVNAEKLAGAICTVCESLLGREGKPEVAAGSQDTACLHAEADRMVREGADGVFQLWKTPE